MSILADASPPERPLRALLADPGFLCVWSIGALSGIVRWLQLLVLGLYTFELTGSPLLVSTVPMLWMIPLALFGPLVGVLADRINRKALLAGALLTMLAVSIAAAILAHGGTFGFGHVAALSLVSGLVWSADMPVRRRLLGDLSGEALAGAMSLDAATANATRMTGPLVGGVMLQVFSLTGVFVLSAALFAACVALLFLTPAPPRHETTVLPAFWRDLGAGLRFVRGDAALRRVLAITIVFNVWGFPFTAMIPVIGADRLGLDAVMVGFLSSAEGLGAFAGAILVALHARPGNFFAIYLGGTIVYLSMVAYLSVLSHVAGGPLHSFLAASLTLVVIGMAGACFGSMQGTLTYLGAPPEYRSRVLGVLTLCIGSGPLGFFNVGWMAELAGVSNALLIISAEGLFALLLLWLYGRETPPPAAGSPR